MKIQTGNKSFQCDKCYTKFHLKWRLDKHRVSHLAKFKRKCLYYNNNKIYPFIKNGCKFAHEVALECFSKKIAQKTYVLV